MKNISSKDASLDVSLKDLLSVGGKHEAAGILYQRDISARNARRATVARPRFLFNDTREQANTLLAIWGGYPLIGIILIIVNEILLRIAFANRSFRRAYGLFWAFVAVAGGCAWAISAYF